MLVVAARETVTQHVYVFTIVIVVVGGGVFIPASYDKNWTLFACPLEVLI